MKITVGMIVQVRYSQRHEYPAEERDHLWFVTGEQRKGRSIVHTIRNLTTGAQWKSTAIEHTFIPVAPNPCP